MSLTAPGDRWRRGSHCRRGARLRSCQFYFSRHLPGVVGNVLPTVDLHAGQEGAVLGVLAGPPLKENRETLRLLRHRPIKLRGAIIEPPFRKPFTRIGVELVVGVES